VILPKELRPLTAKPAVWRSLSTKDNVEAKKAGTVTAVAARMVFQQAADNFLENNAKVVVDAAILGDKLDLDAIADKFQNAEVMKMADSLRQSFGIAAPTRPEGNSSGSNGSSQGSTPAKTPTVKTAKKKSAPGQTSSVQTEAARTANADVEHYLEKRPHGYYRLRFWIPRPLHAVAGQREVRLTLGTKDRDPAIIKAQPMVRDIQKNIDRLCHKTCR
jgi:hypothetical protein